MPNPSRIGNPAVAAPQPQAAPAAAAAPAPAPALPPLPNPEDTLARSQQSYPQASEGVLTGRLAYTDRPAALTAMEAQIKAMPPQTGVTPIIVSDGNTSRIALMPNEGVAGPDVAGKIQRNVMEGKEIFDRVMSDTFTRQPTKEDLTKLMWYLQALGSAKASASSGGNGPAVYKEGGMFIEDPDGKLQDFLTRANSYERSSSHMRDYQSLGGDFSSRGVDIRNTETPNQRKTILFARMPSDREARAHGLKGTGNKRMLFVKMEPHGCRGLTSRGGVIPGESPSKWKNFKRFFANAKDLFMHGAGFLKSAAQRVGLARVDGQNNRERVPSELKTEYTRLLNLARQPSLDGNTLAVHQLQLTLNRDNPLGDSGGIKAMRDNVQAAIGYLAQIPNPGPDTQDLISSLRAFEGALNTRGDHPDLRIGNEVIVTRDEALTNVSLVNPYDGKGVLTGSATLEPEARNIILAGYQYTLDNIDNADRVDTFRVDTHRSAYTIGFDGFERPFDQDTAGAQRAVLALTGNDARVATALMTFANQSLPSDITSRMLIDSMTSAGAPVTVGNEGGTYGISRMHPNNRGETVYVVSYEADVHPPDVPVPDVSRQPVPLDQSASSIKCQVRVQITVHANGSMTPEFVTPPSYSYTLTPQQPQEAAS